MNILYLIIFSVLILIFYYLLSFSRKSIKTKTITQFPNPKISATNELKSKYLELLKEIMSSVSDHYSDIEIIAEGGMGVIAAAYDKERERKVAIKTILPELKEDTGVVELFLQECQVIQAMNHPNVVRIFEVGKSDVLYYYVMDFLEGETLQNIIDRQKKLSVPLTVKIGTQIARALQHIHINGLVHRDIKPSNIFITKNGIAKIIDFGVAKLLNENERHNFGSVGSPLYASPEQLQGSEISGKSDIYSLGVCFFYMLTGEHPYNSTDIIAKMLETPKHIKEINSDIPESMAAIIELCINLDPKSRLAAHELWARLRAINV